MWKKSKWPLDKIKSNFSVDFILTGRYILHNYSNEKFTIWCRPWCRSSPETVAERGGGGGALTPTLFSILRQKSWVSFQNTGYRVSAHMTNLSDKQARKKKKKKKKKKKSVPRGGGGCLNPLKKTCVRACPQYKFPKKIHFRF